MGVTIREMQIGDYEQVWEMWMQSKNMGFNDRDDSREGIDRLLRRNPGRQQRLFRMLQVLLRILFIIIVMQDPDRLPVLRVFPEVFRHGPHGIAYIFRMDEQVLVLHHRPVQFRRPLQAQHTDPSLIVQTHTCSAAQRLPSP